jgi:hypothetical protein
MRRKSQRKLKERIRKAATERAARLSAVERPAEKKPARPARKPSPSAG